VAAPKLKIGEKRRVIRSEIRRHPPDYRSDGGVFFEPLFEEFPHHPPIPALRVVEFPVK
jgi:hypothetical protein